jgi:murein DD-endopeptidase MepM/ murein hydrolase activator NlpD
MRRVALVFVLGVAVATLAWWTAGDWIRARWPLLVQPLSPHERYARALEGAELHETAIGRAWITAASETLQQPQAITAPFSTEATFDAASPAAVGFRFTARRGRRIEVEVGTDDTDGVLFLDLFEVKGDEITRVTSAAAGARTLDYEPADEGVFVLRIQPELLHGGRYTVSHRAVATMRFPVQGVSTRAVQSVFGDNRDRGTRSLEGVDIFAPRGTPAVAATDGWVTGVTTSRLGGNLVWVWDPDRGQALYYAHLDRQDVSPGTRVKAGDPIGRIGNTGNARTTSPHLHFGIYRPLEGAIDPLPFICDAPCGARGMAYAHRKGAGDSCGSRCREK